MPTRETHRRSNPYSKMVMSFVYKIPYRQANVWSSGSIDRVRAQVGRHRRSSARAKISSRIAYREKLAGYPAKLDRGLIYMQYGQFLIK